MLLKEQKEHFKSVEFFITVGRGVLQGDCLSPLFLICASIPYSTYKN